MSRRENREPDGYYAQEGYEAPYGEYAGEQLPPDMAQAVAQAKRNHAKKKSGGLVKFLALLTIVTIGIVVFEQMVLRLETVYVVGNEQKTPQQVVTVSGLRRGQNMLGIEEKDVAAAMAADHTLIFKGMQKEYPSTLYLYVEERRPVAAMQWLGLMYTLDGEGMVMSEENVSAPPPGMPVVTGLIANTVHVGQKLKLRSEGQLEAYQEIMKELDLQLYADQVSEIQISNPESLYLVTVEGVTVRLGDAGEMRAKIGAVNSTMARLRQWGELGGVLDVTTPLQPKYRPED